MARTRGFSWLIRMKRSRRASKVRSLFSLGFELEVGLILHLEGEEILEGGRTCSASRPGPRPSPSCSSGWRIPGPLP